MILPELVEGISRPYSSPFLRQAQGLCVYFELRNAKKARLEAEGRGNPKEYVITTGLLPQHLSRKVLGRNDKIAFRNSKCLGISLFKV